MNKTTKATVELTKTDTGTFLNIDVAGKKIAVSLDGKMSPSGILMDWAEEHLKPPSFTKRWLTILTECLIAGTVTLVLLAAIGGVLWLCYTHAGSMAEGLGLAIGAGLLGGAVRYFRTTRRALHKLFSGSLFR